MADPVWTSQYNTAQTPEGNGFSRTLYNNPTVNIVSSGTPANRRVEIVSNSGACVFETASVPSIDSSIGVTAESLLSCNGTGDAGFELTFLDRFCGINVFANKIILSLPDGSGGVTEQTFATAANTGDTLIRFTYSPDGTGRIYRAGALVTAVALPELAKPNQRVLFWGEGGGTQTFKTMKYYLGGPVAP